MSTAGYFPVLCLIKLSYLPKTKPRGEEDAGEREKKEYFFPVMKEKRKKEKRKKENKMEIGLPAFKRKSS